MLVSYAQESSLGKAVRDTFSGAKPCPMCRAIEASREESGKSSTITAERREIKLLIPSLTHPRVIGPTFRKWIVPGTDFRKSDRVHTLPTPPPRA